MTNTVFHLVSLLQKGMPVLSLIKTGDAMTLMAGNRT